MHRFCLKALQILQPVRFAADHEVEFVVKKFAGVQLSKNCDHSAACVCKNLHTMLLCDYVRLVCSMLKRVSVVQKTLPNMLVFNCARNVCPMLTVVGANMCNCS